MKRLKKSTGTKPVDIKFKWSGQRDSNPRPSPWQGDALPTEPCPRNKRDNTEHRQQTQEKKRAWLKFWSKGIIWLIEKEELQYF